jgi:hypothetical protein
MADRARCYPVIGVIGVSRVTANDLARLAERVRYLAPSHRDPERFHMDKSEIASELRRLAREIEQGNMRWIGA